MAAKATPEKRALPKREADLFRSVAKFYEQKQYKKGIKAADTILKRFPEHGETLAMKGLTLNNLDKKEEARELAKRGLRADIGSHVCWHVYGLLHRADQNYGEAIKCYKSALRIDPDNMQILRDVGNLQIQTREYRGYVETRRRILTLKSNSRPHWLAYAVASHAAGDFDTALSVINAFWDTLQKGERDRNYDNSELVLYKVEVLTEAERYEEALACLEGSKELVMDIVAFAERRAELFMALRRHDEAFEVYRELLRRGAENYNWHRGLQAARLKLEGKQLWDSLKLRACALPCTTLPLTLAQLEDLSDLYAEMAVEFPRSDAIRRMPLLLWGHQRGCDAATVPPAKQKAWRIALSEYMWDKLRRGVPSLGNDLASLLVAGPAAEGTTVVAERGASSARLREAPLVRDPFDVARHPAMVAMIEVVDQSLDSLRETGRLPAEAGPPARAAVPAANGDLEGSDALKEPSETLLWTLFLRAQLLERSGRYAEALAAAEECIRLAPTTPDMYQRKARVLKRAGAFSEAAAVMDAARRLDKSDRYANNKATKYLLRAGAVARAERTVALFTRHEGDPQQNLYEMQCIWYELAWAAAAQRRGDFGPALKKAVAVEEHFRMFLEDQFDFHSYCMRKGTLRTYMAMLGMMDGIYGHQFFCRAAAIAIRIYLAVDARPKESEGGEEPDFSNMSAAEKRKVKAKLRKEAKRKEKEEEEQAKEREAAQRLATAAAAKPAAKADAEAANGADDEAVEEEDTTGAKPKRKGAALPPDDDPYGAKLLAKDPLVEAARLSAALSLHASFRLETHVLAFDVAERRGKPLMALRALVRGLRLAPTDPELMLRTVRFYHNDAGSGAGKGTAAPAAAAAPFLELSPVAARIVANEAESLLGAVSGGVPALIERMVTLAEGPSGSLAARVAAAQALCLTAPAQAARAEALVSAGLRGRGVSVAACEAAAAALEVISNAGAASDFKAACARHFPSAEAFGAAAASLEEGGALDGPVVT